MKKSIKKYIVLILFILAAGTSPLLAGTFAETYGFSAKGMGMGNAMTATVDDWSSVYYNPAGLGKTYKLRPTGSTPAGDMSLKRRETSDSTSSSSKTGYYNQLAINALYTMPVFAMDISRDGLTEMSDADFAAAVIGIAVDMNVLVTMPDIISSARIGVGLGTVLPNYAAKINDIDLRTHNFQRFGRNIQVTKIMLGLGMGFMNDLFGVGLGANMSFGGEGANKLTNVQMNSSETQTPEGQTKMDQTSVTFFTAGAYFSPGRLWPMMKGLEVGMSFRQESYLQIYPVTNDAQMQVGNMSMPMVISMYGFYTPHILNWGVAYSIWDMTFSLDCDFEMWSMWNSSPTKQIVHQALIDQANAAGEDGSLYALPKLRNIFTPKFGFSYQILDWLTARTGYAYQMAFTPDNANTGKINILDNDKHIVSLGATFDLPRLSFLKGPVSITVGYQFQYLVERDVIKIDPEEYDPGYAYGGVVHTVMVETSIKI